MIIVIMVIIIIITIIIITIIIIITLIIKIIIIVVIIIIQLDCEPSLPTVQNTGRNMNDVQFARIVDPRTGQHKNCACVAMDNC